MKFKTLQGDGTVVEIDGQEVHLEYFPDLLVFSHKDERGEWAISEQKTGSMLVYGEASRSKAIKEAIRRCSYQYVFTNGEHDIYELVNKNIEAGRSISKVPYENARVEIPRGYRVKILTSIKTN
ncbi:MAG TPA: hypothetical protein VGK47_07660 [Nitrososphaeraceae archaeon]